MRPIPVPDEWVPPGTHRKVLSAPSGDLTDPDIAPLEVIATSNTLTSYWVTEPGDDLHNENLVVALTCYGPHPPISLWAFDRSTL